MMNKDLFLRRRYLSLAVACAVVIVGMVYYFFFSSMLVKPSTQYVYIDNDDNLDSVTYKLSEISNSHAMVGFRTLTRHSSYGESIKPGRYEIKPGNGAFVVFRKLRSGMQAPVCLTIPSVRTMDKLAEAVAKKMMFLYARNMDMTRKISAACLFLTRMTFTGILLLINSLTR